MRVLHLLNHTRRLNGHVHAAIDLACAQKRQGHTVAIGSQGGDFDALLQENHIQTFVINHERRARQVIGAMLRLRVLVRAWRPDIIHAHMMTSAVLAWPVCRLAGVPLVTTVHNEFEKSAILMGLGDRVIAVSAAVGRSMQKRGVSGSRIHVVLNGTIGSVRASRRCEVPRELAHPAIVFVGGLHPRKGLPDLLQAFEIVHRQAPRTHLYVVGGGPLQAPYATMAASLSCAEAVTMVGPLDDPYPWMLGADIFVLPSHADPAPLVLSEVREAGCAVIATAVDGIPELLEQGRAGILVPPHNPAALAEALGRLIREPETLQAWRENSQINIDYMRIDRVARETVSVYALADRRRADAVAVPDRSSA